MKAFFGWVKQWARTAYEAATRVEFYRTAGARKTGDAVGYLAMFAVVWTLPIAVMFFVGLRQVSQHVAEGLRTDIPPGTVFEMKDGKLSNNLQEPLVFRSEGAVVIVNTASSTLSLQEGESGIVVGQTGIEQSDDVGGETVDFSRAPDFRVTREDLMADIARWAPLALFVASLLALVFMFLTFWGGFLLNALIHGFALWLILKLWKRPQPWRASFIAASYAATAAIVLSMILQGVAQASMLPDLVYWAFIAWIAYDTVKGGAHERNREKAAADRPHTEGKSGPV